MYLNPPRTRAFQAFLLKKFDERHEKMVKEHENHFGSLAWLMPMDSRYRVRFSFNDFKNYWTEFNQGCSSISDNRLKEAFDAIDSPGQRVWGKPEGHRDDDFLSRQEIEDMCKETD